MKFLYASGARPLEGYSIKRGIGRGGFGEVYYATSDGGKQVALKLIRRNLDVEVRGVSHCMNLKNPNLLALYDIKQDEEDNTWVVMEYISGETLEDVVARSPQGLPVPEVLAWIHGIGAGVAYLHDRGIVHRDLKPGNVFCDEGIVKLGDYGLSKFISSSRRSGQTESVGTVHYMAPEVANGRYGKEIDIYALGIMLFEMLTGHVPFEGESVGEVLMKHLTAQPELNDIAEPYRTAVARALEKDPTKRVRSVKEFLAALPQPASQTVLVDTSATKPPLEEDDAQAADIADAQVARAMGAAAAADARAAGAAHIAQAPAQASAQPTVDEEPILKALTDTWRQFRTAWDDANFNTPTRVILIILGISVLISTAPTWMPALVIGGMCYAVYRAVRAIKGTSPKAVPQMAAAPEIAAVAVAERQAERRRRAELRRSSGRRRDPLVAATIVKTPREKFTELTGSMLLSALVCVVLSVVAFLVLQPSYDNNLVSAQFMWLAMLATAGAWMILVPSKLWEGTRGDATLRRFVLLMMGLALGGFGFLVQSVLMVNLPYHAGATSMIADGELAAGIRNTLFESNGDPAATAYLAYFGLLFPVLRWWMLAEPRRRVRFSVWALAPSILWAVVLAQMLEFPDAWGPAVAVLIAASVQLSSPWNDPRGRAVARAAA